MHRNVCNVGAPDLVEHSRCERFGSAWSHQFKMEVRFYTTSTQTSQWISFEADAQRTASQAHN